MERYVSVLELALDLTVQADLNDLDPMDRQPGLWEGSEDLDE